MGLRIDKDVAIGGKASLAVDGDAVWIASGANVLRLDGGSGKVVARIPINGDTGAIAAGEGGVWVNATSPDMQRHALLEIDPATNRLVASIPLSLNYPDGIAAGGGSVWVANALENTLTRIDPRTRRKVGAPLTIDGATGVAVGAGSVWVSQLYPGTVTRVDASTGRIEGAPVRVGDTAEGVAFGEGAAWATGSAPNLLEGSAQVVRIDPAGAKPATANLKGPQVRDVAVTLGGVWALTEDPNRIQRVDPKTRKPAGTPLAVPGAQWMAAGKDALWLATDTGHVLKLVGR